MKTDKTLRQTPENDDMLPEYDLKGKTGVRGKYFEAYCQGHEVRIEGAHTGAPLRKTPPALIP